MTSKSKKIDTQRIALIELQLQQEGSVVSDIINKRKKTHGPYNFTAAWSQALKDMFRGSPNWALMNDGQKEALEMIAAKLARLLNGDHNFRDHLIDIAGYAKLYEISIKKLPQQNVDEIARALGVPVP
jgi:hypothetical protein